jgi:HKD family nuclease
MSGNSLFPLKGLVMAIETRTLLGAGNAAVIGLAEAFDLTKALAHAKQIRLATAFAHMSGWSHVREGISKCKGKVLLLTGLDCNQTEPKLLREWLVLKRSCGDRIEVKLANDSSFFHPKVLIIQGERTSDTFAVVGSGNLSYGGLKTNTECSVLVTDAATIARLVTWFDAQLDSAVSLNDQMVADYEPDYRKSKKGRTALEKAGNATASKVGASGRASLRRWNDALEVATQYFSSGDFESDYSSRQIVAKEILDALHPPEFTFSHEEWRKFFAKKALGNLDERNRDKVLRHRTKLQRALRELVLKPEAGVRNVLGKTGRLRIEGLGVNTVSKILAVYAPNEWPVYNTKVAGVLKEFGYKAPRGADAADAYLAYRDIMKRFMKECKERGAKPVDALALDKFFVRLSDKNRRSQPRVAMAASA